MQKAKVIASLDHAGLSGALELPPIPEAVDYLEIRADLLGEVSSDWLEERFSGRTIFALRSEHQGGRSGASDQERAERICRAAKRYDLVELEIDRDCSPETLAAIPPDKRIVAWYGVARNEVD